MTKLTAIAWGCGAGDTFHCSGVGSVSMGNADVWTEKREFAVGRLPMMVCLLLKG
jgi:hypothetical protein